MKEVNEAYSQVMKMRREGTTNANQGGYNSYGGYGNAGGYGSYGGYGGSAGGYAQQQAEPVEMRAAQNYINTGHYAEALNALGSVPPGKRNAYWYYLSALAQMGLHNNAQAMEYARQAASMEPGNMQYQQLLSQLQSGGSWYGERGEQYGRQQFSRPNICCSILALELCCMCCSGGRMMYYPICCL